MKKHSVQVCNNCGAMQTVALTKPNHILHIIMSIFTLGFWLVIYAAAAFESWAKPAPKCNGCKKRMY